METVKKAMAIMAVSEESEAKIFLTFNWNLYILVNPGLKGRAFPGGRMKEEKRKKNKITVLEAVDNLSTMAELNTACQHKEGWFDAEKQELNHKKIKETFEVLNEYLEHLYLKQRGELKNKETQKGIQAMMQLAGEAADKVEKLSHVFKGSIEEVQIPEYKQLHKFYLSKVASKLNHIKKEQNEAGISVLNDGLGLEKQALKDLEVIRSDVAYEFLYISGEDGSSFVSPHLYRHMRLVRSFDESCSEVDFAEFKMRLDLSLDRQYHFSAKMILEESSAYLADFYREGLQYRKMPLISSLNKALMALMLAANPKNLLTYSKEKSCLGYFIDFQRYLRQALSSVEEEKALKEKKNFFYKTALFMRSLCHFLFLNERNHTEVLHLISQFVKDLQKKELSFWAHLSAVDEAIRESFKQYPNGPLMKAVEALDQRNTEQGFDPLLQHNLPFQLFTLSSETIQTTFLHLPCPLIQKSMHHIEVAPEFLGYLTYLGQEKKHLLIDLQDRTAWKEHKRAEFLEKLAEDSLFSSSLFVISLAKDSSFYHQTEEYVYLERAEEFKEQMQAQVVGGKQCGFYFPREKEIASSIQPIIDMVHLCFYQNKEVLDRKERLDFIELFYFFMVLLILEKEAPDTLSFTCKDGIDTGNSSAAIFFGGCKLLSNAKPWEEKEREFFLITFYAPSILVRHRAIFSQRFYRSLSTLSYFDEVMQKNREKVLKECARLFPDFPFKLTYVA